MDSVRKTALVAGVLYLVTFVSSIPALMLLHPVLHNPGYITSSGADTRVILGCMLDLVNALSAIGTAVALYPVVRRQNEGIALGYVASRAFEAAVIVIGVVCLLAVVSLRQDLAGATGANAAGLVTTGRSLVAIRDWTFLLGPGLMPAFNALFLGYLMYKSRLVPRIIPTLGLIGAPLLIIAAVTTVFGVNEQLSLWSGIATAPIFAWELSVGLWMTVKGFRPSPITAGLAEASTPPLTRQDATV